MKETINNNPMTKVNDLFKPSNLSQAGTLPTDNTGTKKTLRPSATEAAELQEEAEHRKRVKTMTWKDLGSGT